MNIAQEIQAITARSEMEASIHMARKGVIEEGEDRAKNERLRELYKLLGERRKVTRWWR